MPQTLPAYISEISRMLIPSYPKLSREITYDFKVRGSMSLFTPKPFQHSILQTRRSAFCGDDLTWPGPNAPNWACYLHPLLILGELRCRPCLVSCLAVSSEEVYESG